MWRCGDLVVSVLISRLNDKSLSPGGETVLCSWAWHFTHTQCLSPGRYTNGYEPIKYWVSNIPSRRESIFLVVSCYRDRDKLRPGWAIWLAYRLYLFTWLWVHIIGGLIEDIKYNCNITGDRAKMNKLVQMAWTFSNDRFVCCCCLSLSIVLPLTPFISEYHWWALGITSELSCCWYSSPTRQQVCYVCEDQGHRWLTAYDSPVVLVITATTVTAAGKKKIMQLIVCWVLW